MRFDISFLNIRFLDALDILLVAIIIYYAYNLIRGTIAVNIFIGLVIIYLIYMGVKALQMQLLAEILGGFISVGFLALIIVFQQEIRRFLLLIGKKATFKRDVWSPYFYGKKKVNETKPEFIKPIIEACKSMKKSHTGALIVFAKFFDEQYYQNKGELMDARISKRLLESIFHKNGPLHDGAVVVSQGRIKSANCILPLTDNESLPVQFGLRHRAGIGVTEVTDAVAVIVSESTGEIAYAKQGRVKTNVNFAELEQLLNKDI